MMVFIMTLKLNDVFIMTLKLNDGVYNDTETDGVYNDTETVKLSYARARVCFVCM